MARNNKNESRDQWFTKQATHTQKKSKPRNCFRRFNKTDRPMARLIKKEKITEMARIRNE